MRNIKVLIIEDETEVAKVIELAIKETFKNSPLQIDHKVNGAEALVHISKNNKYDLIICDIIMPRLSGNEFIDKARDILDKDIPIIILTANVKQVEVNPDKYLYTMSKPFDLERFSKIVKIAIGSQVV